MTRQSTIKLLKRLWRHISPHHRNQFGLLIILMVLASVSEMFSVGAIMPFLAMLSSPEHIFDLPGMQFIGELLNLKEPKDILFSLAIIFGAAVLIAGCMRLLLVWASARLAFAAGANLSANIYRRTLYQSYIVHCEKNSSELIGVITNKTNGVIYNIIFPALTLISSSIILIALLIILIAVDPLISFSAFLGFGLIYFFIAKFSRSRLMIDSDCIAQKTTQIIKSLQEGLGGIRDVLIDGTQETYCQIYSKSDLPMRRAQGNSLFISNSPRYIVEALGMLLIVLLACFLAQQPNGISKIIPILGVLALGAQRLLPVLQQAYSAWTQIKSGQTSLQDTLELLDQELPDYANNSSYSLLPFKKHIDLKDVCFRYNNNTPLVLKNINLKILKGSRIGIIGASGSGKSTLLDILMGLLQPTDGTIKIDGQSITLLNNRSWQAHIAHVPQAIFLADSSIEENIAFGVPREEIDIGRLYEAAAQAQIANDIESWPNQYKTFVGERGVRLSGGQRQRIGIARALYKKADIIIFDEATSALDSKTEQAVIRAIENLSNDLTLFIVAHRLSTLKNCSQIVEVDADGIKRIGSYHDIIKA